MSEAAAAERLAAVVSYGPDKARLLAQAESLRREACVAEARSWKPASASGPARRRGR